MAKALTRRFAPPLPEPGGVRPKEPLPVALHPRALCAHDRGCLRAPGFPCALFVFEGIADRITPGASRRENAEACLVGWVERSETHRTPRPSRLMGIASLHPSYGSRSRHCERSEAIHLSERAELWIASSLCSLAQTLRVCRRQ